MAPPLRAVLFDLDGTLLPHRFEDFLPRYLESVGRSFAATLPGVDVVHPLLASTKVMFANDGEETNEESFWRHFASLVPHPREDLYAKFMRFYEEDFPSLRDGIARDPAAAAAVEACRTLGLKVALASNAVFPRIALEERARWAGVEPSRFDLITSIEWMRSCKPHRAYYRQIAEELSVAPEECLMIGNDVSLDLAPAAAIGMRTCLVESAYAVDQPGFVPDVRCALAEVPGVVERLARSV